jgi:hypothetical protein
MHSKGALPSQSGGSDPFTTIEIKSTAGPKRAASTAGPKGAMATASPRDALSTAFPKSLYATSPSGSTNTNCVCKNGNSQGRSDQQHDNSVQGISASYTLLVTVLTLKCASMFI